MVMLEIIVSNSLIFRWTNMDVTSIYWTNDVAELPMTVNKFLQNNVYVV